MLSRVTAFVICVSICAGFALAPAANAAIVTNGDFATGDFTGWTLFTTPNGGLGGSASGLPAVTSFNVTGSGAQNAASSKSEKSSSTGRNKAAASRRP